MYVLIEANHKFIIVRQSERIKLSKSQISYD